MCQHNRLTVLAPRSREAHASKQGVIPCTQGQDPASSARNDTCTTTHSARSTSQSRSTPSKGSDTLLRPQSITCRWTSGLAKQSGLQQRTTDCVCRCIFGSTVHHDAPTTVREAHFDGSNYSTGSLRLSPVQYPVGVPSTALNRWPLICL